MPNLEIIVDTVEDAIAAEKRRRNQVVVVRIIPAPASLLLMGWSKNTG
jgi:hypothetical protein